MSSLLILLLLEGALIVGAREADTTTISNDTTAKVHTRSETRFFIDELGAGTQRRRRYRRKRRRARAPMRNTSYAALQKVRVGAWGGEHISLEVADAQATVELDCAGGMIDEPLRLDSNNRFDARGSFVKAHGGPVEQGEQEDRHPARFTGWTDGRRMTLTITLTDEGNVVGNFTLEFGKAPQITRCL